MQIQFDETWLTGHPDIDAEHKALVGCLAALHAGAARGASQAEIDVLLDALTDYGVTHFQNEEVLMHRLHYYALHDHRKAHEFFWRECLLTHDTYRRRQDVRVILDRIEEVLMPWLAEHFVTQDTELVFFIRSRMEDSGG